MGLINIFNNIRNSKKLKEKKTPSSFKKNLTKTHSHTQKMSEEEEEPKPTTTTTEKEETSKSDDEQDKEKENNEDGGEKPLKETNSMIVLNGAQEGSKVYVVGMAHFSEESQKEVAELIRRVRPSRVVIEL